MANMRKRILISIFIMLVDIAAGVLGIWAQVAEDNEKNLTGIISECKEASTEAYRLGLGACMLVAAVHVIANVLGGCVCIRSREEYGRSSSYRLPAMVSLILSWIILCVAFSMLVVGTASARTRINCVSPHDHVFMTGGILCFIHGLLLVTYYIAATSAKTDERLQSIRRRAPHQPLPA